jgi:hypothetical protein
MTVTKRPRVIHEVETRQDRAKYHHDHLWYQGRHPRIHKRQVRAEGVVMIVYVVVADTDQAQ